jgi:integrase
MPKQVRPIVTDLNQLLPTKGTREYVSIIGFTGLRVQVRVGAKGVTRSFVHNYKTNTSDGKRRDVYVSLGPFDGTKSSIDIALQRYYASAEAKAHGRVASTIELDEEMGAPTDGRVHNSGGRRVREVMRRYNEERMTKVRPISRVNWNTYSKSFEAAIGDRLIKTITQPMIEKWLRELVDTVRLTANPDNKFAGHPTFNNAKKCITAFFGWAVKRKLADENPALHIELMKVADTGVTISDTDFKTYLRTLWGNHEQLPAEREQLHICPSLRHMLGLMIYTGMRPGEVRQMRYGDYDFLAKKITIPSHRAKDGKRHELPVSNETHEILRAQIEHTGYTEPNDLIFPMEKIESRIKGMYRNVRNFEIPNCRIQTFHNRVCDKAGINRFRAHGLRHLFISYTPRLGINGEVSRLLTSHSIGVDVHNRVYNNYDYQSEMREAACRMAVFLSALAGRQPNMHDTLESGDFWASQRGKKHAAALELNLSDDYVLHRYHQEVVDRDSGYTEGIRKFEASRAAEEAIGDMESARRFDKPLLKDEEGETVPF